MPAQIECVVYYVCWTFLQDASKHIDHSAMCACLHALGLSKPHELQFIDDFQVKSIEALLKPVAAKLFARIIGVLRNGQKHAGIVQKDILPAHTPTSVSSSSTCCVS